MSTFFDNDDDTEEYDSDEDIPALIDDPIIHNKKEALQDMGDSQFFSYLMKKIPQGIGVPHGMSLSSIMDSEILQKSLEYIKKKEITNIGGIGKELKDELDKLNDLNFDIHSLKPDNNILQIIAKSQKSMSKKIKKNINGPTLTTDGITSDIYIDASPEQKKGLFGHACNLCGLYYPQDIVVMTDEMGQCCWHCIFWTNPTEEDREELKDTLNLTIDKYITRCKEQHILDVCTRDGCILCNMQQDTKDEDDNEFYMEITL